MSYLKSLQCLDCRKEYGIADDMTACPECAQRGLFHGILDPVYDYGEIAKQIDRGVLERRTPSLWKYWEFMPGVDRDSIVTMGEGGTPLVKCSRLNTDIGTENLYLKNESLSPTLSFKDRVMSLAVSRVKRSGLHTAALATDGNCGAAAAAYCAKAGIACHVFMPVTSSPSKINRVLVYGANVILIEGSLLEAGMLAMQACKHYGWANITQAKALNPYLMEGHRSISYEICEQLRWRSPDWLLTPTTGESFAVQWKGYKEFQKLGFVGGLPKMTAVQGEGADPLVKAFAGVKQWFEVEPFEPKTICDAIPVSNIFGPAALNAIHESGGRAVAVSDEEALEGQRLLAVKEGIFAEPTSSIPVMAVRKLIREGIIRKEETVVCIVTGAGPNVPEVVERFLKKPASISPTMEALDRLIQ